MEAIILAGGFGTRLRSVVPDLPKPMAPIAGMPFLEILLKSLSRKGITRVILSVGHMHDKIVSCFGDTFLGLPITYEIEATPLGTGGAIRQSLRHCRDDHALILNGDTFLDLEINAVEEQWQRTHRPIIVAREVEDTRRFGRLEASDGRITRMTEKGMAGRGFINAGAYILPVHILDSFTPGQPFSIEADFLVKELDVQPFDIFITRGDFIDIGIPEDYARAQVELAKYRI